MEQFKGHAFAQFLEPLEIQLMDLFQKGALINVLETSWRAFVEESCGSPSFVAPFTKEIFEG
jgi:hypothetical protein